MIVGDVLDLLIIQVFSSVAADATTFTYSCSQEFRLRPLWPFIASFVDELINFDVIHLETVEKTRVYSK